MPAPGLMGNSRIQVSSDLKGYKISSNPCMNLGTEVAWINFAGNPTPIWGGAGEDR